MGKGGKGGVIVTTFTTFRPGTSVKPELFGLITADAVVTLNLMAALRVPPHRPLRHANHADRPNEFQGSAFPRRCFLRFWQDNVPAVTC